MSATGSSVSGTVTATSNCRRPSSATAAISARMPPKWVYTAIVDVPAADGHLAGLQRVGTVLVEQADGGVQQLVANAALVCRGELIVAIVSRAAYCSNNVDITML